MHNTDRNRQGAVETTRQWHSGPTEEGQSGPSGTSGADLQSIDLNHATWQQFLEVEGFDEQCARTLVEHRTHHGHFRTWEDVAAVPGLTRELVTSLQHAARIGGIEVA
jgi:DNA uptake protein ComE-like DNA-binding protein